MSESQSSQALAEGATPLKTARIYSEHERWQEALQALAPLLAESAEAEAFRLASAAHRNLENPVAARRVVEQGLARWPGDDTLHAELGRVLALLSLEQAALAEARKAISIDPQWFGHHYLEAWLLFRAGQFAEAEAAVRRALGLSPNQADCLWLLGAVLYELDRNDQARSIVRQGLESAPKHADLLMLDGILQNKRSARIGRFRQALGIDPTDRWKQRLLYQHERAWRRDLAWAAGICLLQLALRESQLPASTWLQEALFVISGTVLANPQRLKWLWAFASVNIWLIAASGSLIGLFSGLPEHFDWNGLSNLLSDLAASSVLALVAIWLLLGLRVVSIGPLQLAWKFLVELFQARGHGVLVDKLREIARSRNTCYHLIGCALPTLLPLVGREIEATLVALFYFQPAITWLAGRWLLPRENRTSLWLLFTVLSIPLGIVYEMNLLGESWNWTSRSGASVGFGLYTLLAVNGLRKL